MEARSHPAYSGLFNSSVFLTRANRCKNADPEVSISNIGSRDDWLTKNQAIVVETLRFKKLLREQPEAPGFIHGVPLPKQPVNPCGERIQNVSKNLRIVAASPSWDMKRMIGFREYLERCPRAELFANRPKFLERRECIARTL
jgi:hypothetical protein